MKQTIHDPLAWIDERLAALDDDGLLRHREAHLGRQSATIQLDGQSLVNCGSNDYLGLAVDPRVIAAAADTREFGAGASPLVTGFSADHQRLERQLAEFEQSEAALVFASGYAANLGTITALVGRGDAIFSDAKNHASMIDGCRLSRADVHIYPHCDWQALAALLRSSQHYARRLIVTESIFSMDGDAAPLMELAGLAHRHEAMLLVDEAHATGVFGRHGRGLAEELGVEQQAHIKIGTLSKALGSAGGFVAGSRKLTEWLANRARPYVFSTALPAACCRAAAAALSLVEAEPQRRASLRAAAGELRRMLAAQGWSVGDGNSQIIPLFIGGARAAVDHSARLRDAGFLVPAIRPPSVATGQSLLRISVTAGHTPPLLAQLAEALGPFAAGP